MFRKVFEIDPFNRVGVRGWYRGSVNYFLQIGAYDNQEENYQYQ